MDQKIDTQKIKDAIMDMMAKVKISDDHNYSRVSDGKFFAGVSTISGILPKDWLSAWGAKEAVKFLGYTDDGATLHTDTCLEKIKGLTSKQYHDLLHEAKGACRRKSKDALVDGKTGHAWLELWVKAKIRKQSAPIMPTGMLERPLKQFLEWEANNVQEWVLSEARVADLRFEFAGTLDALAIMKTGRLAVIDYKFAQYISDEYALQTAGYSIPFEQYDIKIDDRIIVRLPKTETRQEYDKVTHKYKMIPNDIEVKIIDSPYDFDRETFLAARQIQKWLNFIENKSKN